MKGAISACLIARDEAGTIIRCLDSLRGIDEIVVHDTGSVDRTVQLARGMGAKVITSPPLPRDDFHFGNARQIALSNAAYPWVLSIDADEVLLPGALAILRKATEGEFESFEVGFLHRVNHKDRKPKRESLKRFFRRDLHEWRYRIHEQAVAIGEARLGKIREIILDHYPTKSRKGRKGQNLNLLWKACQETPEYARLHRYLAGELHQLRDLDGALRAIDRYLEVAGSEPRMERSEGFLFRGMLLRDLGRGQEAVKSCWRSWQTMQDRREPLYLAAEITMAAANYKGALWWLERVLDIPVSKKPISPLTWERVWGRIPEEAARHCRQKLEEEAARSAAAAKGGGA